MAIFASPFLPELPLHAMNINISLRLPITNLNIGYRIVSEILITGEGGRDEVGIILLGIYI